MKNKTFAVLGLGSFGMGVADALMERGAEVLAADRDEQLIRENAEKYTRAVIADLTDEEEIRQLGLGNMDAVIVCMPQNLEASIMCVMIAKESGVHRVIAAAESQRKGEVLKKIGADKLVFPGQESGVRTAFQLMFREVLQFFDLTSDLVVAEIEPRKEWFGKTLDELDLRKRYGINVIALRRGEKVYDVSGSDMVIQSGEPLLIVISKANLEAFVE